MTSDGLRVPEAPPSHWLHSADRVWTESNCYADIWIEVEHALGFDPVAGLGYTLGATFDADQWTFIKPYPADLELLYGLDVREINPWLPIEEHIAEEVGRGNLLTVEVDSFHLPDTAGVSYGIEHVKTTIVPATIDPTRRLLRYFHGQGYQSLSGEDYDGVLGLGADPELVRLPPYVELVRRSAPASMDRVLATRACQTAREHLGRRPSISPVSSMADHVVTRLPELRAIGSELFHRYAFVTCRQCGATAELAADFAEWLAKGGDPSLADAAPLFRSVAQDAKALQFSLARAARGRRVEVTDLLAGMVDAWEGAMAVMERSLLATP